MMAAMVGMGGAPMGVSALTWGGEMGGGGAGGHVGGAHSPLLPRAIPSQHSPWRRCYGFVLQLAPGCLQDSI